MATKESRGFGIGDRVTVKGVAWMVVDRLDGEEYGTGVGYELTRVDEATGRRVYHWANVADMEAAA